MRACDATVQVLIETDNPSVMYGDEWLCHQIAKRLGWEHAGPTTSRRVLIAARGVRAFCTSSYQNPSTPS